MASVETITVGCKLPHGLQIPLGSLEDTTVDGKQVKMFRPNGRHITLNGYHAKEASAFGVGITDGVDAAEFRAWAEKHREFAPLARGLIFEVKRPSDAPAAAKERADLKSGFEGLDPEKPAPKVQQRED